jgi:hypothetical protein
MSNMAQKRAQYNYLFCLKNDGYPAALERGKVYRAIGDAGAEAKGLVRVIDESGEDYLYPADRFVAISLPAAAQRTLARAS